MNKPRFFLSLFALLVLLGIGLLLLNHKQPSPPVSTSTLTTATPGAASVVKIATPSKPLTAAVESTQPTTLKAEKNLSIGDLLTDPSLDNKTVMSGLSDITLDANRALSERTEAMSHLLNLSVEDPAPVLLPLVNDPRLPDSLCNQILDDSLNDSLSWQADAYLAALAHRDGQEIQTKAREHLTFLVGEDHGDNIAEWSKAIDSAKAKWAQPSN